MPNKRVYEKRAKDYIVTGETEHCPRPHHNKGGKSYPFPHPHQIGEMGREEKR